LNRPPHREFREFVSAHADRIYNHAFRMLRNREDAEEAVQDIFLKVHRGMADFRGHSEIRTWLYRITVNTCLTRLRRTTPQQVHPDAEETETGNRWDTIVSDDDSPEDLLIEKDIKSFMVNALELISPDDKEILLLFHVDELKYEEIANVLDIPIGTVCVRLYRARKKLSAAMGAIQKELTVSNHKHRE